MKKIGLSLIVVLHCFVAKAQNTKFTLDGTIKGKSDGFIYIGYTDNDGKQKSDSAAIINNAFKFVGDVKDLSNAYLRSSLKIRNMEDLNFASFFIEPSQMKLELVVNDFKNYKLIGSKTDDESRKLSLQKAPIRDEMKPILDAYNIANAAYSKAIKDKLTQEAQDVLHKKANDLRDQFEPFNNRMDKIDYAFIAANPNSFLSAYLMIFKVSGLSLDSVKLFYNKMTPKVQKSTYGKQIAEGIIKLQKGSPGAIATVFSATDINGKPLSLTDFKGKYVLLDFWASWCVPCREGNPHLKTLYAKYKDKGFEIIGVSDDDSKPDAWKNAVAQDQIGIWKHILRGLKLTSSGYDRTNDISENFGIHTLPTKILIDKNGKIIGRYGGGGEDDAAMDKKLIEVLGK